MYIYTMEYYSAIKRDTFELVLMRWVDLEPIIESDISQKEKDRGEESRWRRNRTGRSLSLLQIHRKNNRTENKVYKTTSDR